MARDVAWQGRSGCSGARTRRRGADVQSSGHRAENSACATRADSDASEPARAMRELLGNPNVGSKKWIYRQYDSIVLSNTILGPGSDAAVLRIKGSKRGLAMKVDSNPRACALDPYLGAVSTVCEAVRNVACAGARSAGITNCLNYGNPEQPPIMWQFTRGIAALSRCLHRIQGTRHQWQRELLQRDRGASDSAHADHRGGGHSR